MEGGDLIPGLPDEVALECLIRVPYDSLPAVRSVCKLWRQELESTHFRHLRLSRGFARPLVVLAQAELPIATGGLAKKYFAPCYRLAVYEPGTASWGALPPIPCLRHGLPLFCRIAAAGWDLVVVGGWDPETWAVSDEVHVYSFASGQWRRGARMPGPRRSFFSCASTVAGDRRMLVVAGGHDKEKNALRSAVAYDVAGDEWVPLPDMARERDECHGVFTRGGMFHVIGGYTTEMQGCFCRSGEAFDVATWTWGPVEEDVLESATCPRACLAGPGGILYACAAGKVAVAGGATWRAVAELPEDVRVATQVVGWEREMMVMGSGIHGGALSGYTLELELGEEGREPTWRKVDMSPEYSGHIQAACTIKV